MAKGNVVFLKSTMKAGLAAANERRSSADASRLISVPVRMETADTRACQETADRGRYLARQGRWDLLSAEVLNADRHRASTPAGTPVSELLAFGARSDLVAAAEHGLQAQLEAAPNASLV